MPIVRQFVLQISKLSKCKCEYWALCTWCVRFLTLTEAAGYGCSLYFLRMGLIVADFCYLRGLKSILVYDIFDDRVRQGCSLVGR